ncbi:Uracil-DNA glycosylase, family 4, partial [hydrothermal vent metagenome]
DYIVCWGSVAARKLLSTKTPIGKMRQQFFDYGRAKVACTYHPAYLLRNPPAKKEVWADMKWLMKDMGVKL